MKRSEKISWSITITLAIILGLWYWIATPPKYLITDHSAGLTGEQYQTDTFRIESGNLELQENGRRIVIKGSYTIDTLGWEEVDHIGSSGSDTITHLYRKGDQLKLFYTIDTLR